MENDNETSGVAIGARLNIPTRDDYERHLVEKIESIQLAARKAAEPYIEALARLRANDPSPPFILTQTQVDEGLKHLMSCGISQSLRGFPY
jgi:hypothetical protein